MTRSGFSLVIAALLLQAPAARAAQLDKDSCSKLKTEQALLEQGGARGSLGKGPQWGKANLAPEKLEQVRRLIEVDEQLLFRCGGRPLVLMPSDPDPAARGEGESKDDAQPKAVKPPGADKKAPDAEKKAVPLKKATAPPVAAPVVAAPKAPSAAPAPSQPPQAAPAPPAAASPPPASDVAKVTPPAETAPQPAAGPTPAPAVVIPASATPAPTVPPAAAAPATAVPAAPTAQPTTLPADSAAAAKEAEDKKAAAIKAAKAKAKKKAAEGYSSPADWISGLLSPAPAKK